MVVKLERFQPRPLSEGFVNNKANEFRVLWLPLDIESKLARSEAILERYATVNSGFGSGPMLSAKWKMNQSGLWACLENIASLIGICIDSNFFRTLWKSKRTGVPSTP